MLKIHLDLHSCNGSVGYCNIINCIKRVHLVVSCSLGLGLAPSYGFLFLVSSVCIPDQCIASLINHTPGLNSILFG